MNVGKIGRFLAQVYYELVFEGRYGELIRKINREEASTKNEQNN